MKRDSKRVTLETKPAEEHCVVACLGGDETALERRPVPVPGPGELLLKLRVVGFCGTDLFKLDTGSAVAGTVLGHELVGEVIARGAGVTQFKEADRVVVPHHVPCGSCALCRRGSETLCETFRVNEMEPGGFADKVLIRPRATAQAAHKVPDGVSDEKAVFVEPAACVLRGVRRSGLDDGQGPDSGTDQASVAVVLGAGSMGLLHLLVLRAVYPELAVVMVDPTPARREIATGLGAARTAAPGDAAQAAVQELSQGLGADAVFDTVGGNRTLEAALSLSRQGGSVVLFAHAPEGARADFDLNSLFKFERRIVGTYSGALKEQEEIFALLCDGRLDPTPLATHSLPLDDFRDGLALVRGQQALKVLFTPSRAQGTR